MEKAWIVDVDLLIPGDQRICPVDDRIFASLF